MKSHFRIATFLLRRILSTASLHRRCQTLFRLSLPPPTDLPSQQDPPSSSAASSSSLRLLRFTKLLTEREVQLPPASLNVLIEGGRIGRVGVQLGSAGCSCSRSRADRGRTTATATAPDCCCRRGGIRRAVGRGDVRTAGRDATVSRCRRRL